jgi:glycerol-3-phosphate dehydrogenase
VSLGCARTEGASEAFDVVVVGGGVLGTAIALRLAMTDASVCLLEREDDLCEGSSKGNAGITTTYYASEGTLEAQVIAESWPRWDDLCARLDVPFQRIGSLSVALTAEQQERLPELHRDAVAAGAVNARLIGGEEARELEPMLSPAVSGALLLPDEGIIDPVRLTWAYAELAALNGAAIRVGQLVTGFESDDHGRLTGVHTTGGDIACRHVVNAAGLGAGVVSAQAGGEPLDVHPRKGQYWVLDRAFGERMSKMILPVPLPHTRGVQVVPTTNGSVLLGPSAHDHDDERDRSTEPQVLEEIVELCRALVPEVSPDDAIKTYAANRATTGDETLRLRADPLIANLVQVGNRSTGMSCSPAVADRTLAILREQGLQAADRPGAVDRLEPVRRLLLDDDPETIDAGDPLYRQVVCVCEDVTAAEITAALKARVPARSIEGVRKRTRATGGRCQGSVCMAGVAFLCSLHLNCTPEDVRVGAEHATLGVGHA